MSEKSNDVNFVYDALKERLPAGWSLARATSDNEQHTPFYRWTDWRTGQYMIVAVNEQFADPLTVDQLCDKLMDAVYESFNDPKAKYSSPLWQREGDPSHE